MSSASDASLYIIEETVAGTIPTTGNLNEMAFSSFSLTAAPTFTQSSLIRSNRIAPDSIKTGDEVQGTISSEFSEDTFDLLLAAGMSNNWDTSGATVDTLEVGDIDKTFTILEEWGYLSEALKRHVYPQCQVGSFSITVQNEEIVGIEFTIAGKSVQFPTTDLVGLTKVPASPNSSLNACQDTTNIQIDGAPINTVINSVSVEVNNNIRAIKGLGVCGPQRFTKGLAQVGGTAELFHDDESELLYRKSVNNESSSLSFSLAAPAGKVYTFTFPKVKMEVPGPTAEGQDSDVTLSANYTVVDQTPTITRTR